MKRGYVRLRSAFNLSVSTLVHVHLLIFESVVATLMAEESKGAKAWCIYVSFAAMPKVGEVKVPCKGSDTIRHVLIKVSVFKHTL